MSVVVLDTPNFGRPMRVYTHDGREPAPPGGILFYADGCAPSTFKTAEDAEAVIARSIAWRNARGGSDSRDKYQVADLVGWEQEIERKARKKLKRKKVVEPSEPVRGQMLDKGWVDDPAPAIEPRDGIDMFFEGVVTGKIDLSRTEAFGPTMDEVS